MSDNKFQKIDKVESIKTFYELMKLVQKYNEFASLTKEAKYLSSDEIESVFKRLAAGIAINRDEEINSLVDRVLSFLTQYGFSKEIFKSMFDNTRFVITDLKSAYNSKAYAQSTKKTIFYDHSIIDFDDNGIYKGFNPENIDFLRHITIHELLHRVSAYRDDKKDVNVNDSALSEGFTDYYATLISNYNGKDKSKTYEFVTRICKIFSQMIGIEKSLSDYINNIGSYPNLQSLFNSYNFDFREFEFMFNSSLMKRREGGFNEEIYEYEADLLTILKDNLFVPYLADNPDKIELRSEIENLLNSYGILLKTEKRL